MNNASRTALVWLGVGALILGAVAFLKVFENSRKRPVVSASATPPPVLTVQTAVAQPKSLREKLSATGSIYAVDSLSVGAEVNGLRITSVDAEEGMWVSRGQVLARLNPSILEAQLAEAQARYRGSLAQVSKARQPNRPQDIASAQAAVLQAQANEAQERANVRQAQTNLKYSQRTANRYSKVLDEGFVTAQESQDKETEMARNRELVTAAQQRLQASSFATAQARKRLELAEAGGRSEDVTIAQSSSAEMAGAIELLQAQLDQTVIRAPADGMVSFRDAHLGDIVMTSKPLFTLARSGQLELRAQVPEIDLNRIKVGDVGPVELGDGEIRGRVWKISPTVDPATRLGTVRIMLNTREGPLSQVSREKGSSGQPLRVLPGMFARATLDLGQHQVLTVPSNAVLGGNGHNFVFLYENGKAKRREIEVGERSNNVIEVKAGLKPNEQVIIKGSDFLSDGDTVEVGR